MSTNPAAASSNTGPILTGMEPASPPARTDLHQRGCYQLSDVVIRLLIRAFLGIRSEAW